MSHSNKKKSNTNTVNTINESQKQYAKWKNSNKTLQNESKSIWNYRRDKP